MRLDSTLIVTIYGPSIPLDLELPGDVTIGELLPLLLEMSSQAGNAPYTLRQTDAGLYMAGMYAPLPLHETLIGAGVCNGAELELRIQGSYQKPFSGAVSQPSGRRSVQPSVGTGNIGITWQPLI